MAKINIPDFYYNRLAEAGRLQASSPTAILKSLLFKEFGPILASGEASVPAEQQPPTPENRFLPAVTRTMIESSSELRRAYKDGKVRMEG